ncbi:MAG: ECF transporter S component [candidate division Zixibacteria bacterium]
MMKRSRLIARVAIFSALAYVFAYASFYIPNVSLIFIVIFAAGAIYGIRVGILVGGIGEFLWTVFNPYGMATVPTMISQIVGMILVGALGGFLYGFPFIKKVSPTGFIIFAIYGLLSGLVFQILLNGVEAWLYGPFWEYLLAGMSFALFTIFSNMVIFPVCYPVIVKLCSAESKIGI